MTNDELLAIRDLLTASESRIMDRVDARMTTMQTEMLAHIDEKIKAVQTETMQGAAVLLESQFMGHFKLLLEKMDDVLRKVPSDEDMDIIDDTLQEHDGEIKMLRYDVNELKQVL